MCNLFLHRHCIFAFLFYYLNFGKYYFNICTFLKWKMLTLEMSSHFNLTCSAKFVYVCILVVVCGFLCSLSHVQVCLWLHLCVAYLTLEHPVLICY